MIWIIIQWQDQLGRWHRFQQKRNQADAWGTAQARARSTGMRHRPGSGQSSLYEACAHAF